MNVGDLKKMLRMEAKSMVVKTDKSGPPRAKYLPSGAIKALRLKHVKMTHAYNRAEMTMVGSMSHTASIKGPVDSPANNIISNH